MQPPTRTTTGVEALTEAVRARVEQRAAELAEQGRSLELGDVDALADRMVAALPTVHPLDQPLGPFYDTTGLVAWLGISRQALFDRVRRGTVLACRTADGHLVYPSLQFGRNGVVRPGVQDAVGAFVRRGVDGWSIGAWLTTPSTVFDGHSAVDYLVVHRSSSTSVARVATAAANDAAQWAA
ncbi:hypothetical protein SAMN04489867_0989 [Pedococcus dokdonensis]|uniref:Uncharacterized protein n=1 Tax=Pedococcus dokdonensis TaxID=443156 RepID=A0A1H0NNZ0_9MICO|nr:hypothetical protein [Pedococcus dokdonensis]SDO94125.1 hypothetical protein SAMN04489867_0989 [Pedococcus dokdonensis]